MRITITGSTLTSDIRWRRATSPACRRPITSPAARWTAMMWRRSTRQPAKPWPRSAGRRPSFLECRTYRWHKHFLSDHLEDLRPGEELVAWKKRCPVLAFEVKWLADCTADGRGCGTHRHRDHGRGGRRPTNSPWTALIPSRKMLWKTSIRSERDAMREITYEQAIQEAIQEEFRRDPRTVHLSTDLPRELREEFGADRIRVTPSRRTPSSGRPSVWPARASGPWLTSAWPPSALWPWTRW